MSAGRHISARRFVGRMLEQRTGKDRTLAFFLEGEFALLVVILVLPSTPIFTTLDR